MKHFIEGDAVFAFEDDGSQDHLITAVMVPISDEAIRIKVKADEEQEFNALSYVEKRSREYPLMTDYLDGLVKGDQAQMDLYIERCAAVKTKYPKGA